MKAASFQYCRARDLPHAITLLGDTGSPAVKVLGGGQSLGPMINLRLVQPERLVDISAVRALHVAAPLETTLRLGAGIRHAQIEDGQITDVTKGLLRHVAGGIAHRAVRNRGTLGGSLVHADPAADWVATTRLLDASLVLESPRGVRMLVAREFFQGAFATAIAEDEVLTAIDVPRFSAQARWAYEKTCRKPGEFADALAALWIDPVLGMHRAVIGALSTTPHLVEGEAAIDVLQTRAGLSQALDDADVTDPVDRQLQTTMLRRALLAVGLSDPGAGS